MCPRGAWNRAFYELYRYCFPEKLYLFSSIFKWCKHLQGIFPTQESNPGLPHCRQTLYHLSHQVCLSVCIYKSISMQICEVSVTQGCLLCRLLPSPGQNEKTIICLKSKFAQPGLKTKKVNLQQLLP